MVPEMDSMDPIRAAAGDATFAAWSVQGVVRTLRRFDPEASRDVLFRNVCGIVHSEAFVGALRKRSKSALCAHVSMDQSLWLTRDSAPSPDAQPTRRPLGLRW